MSAIWPRSKSGCASTLHDSRSQLIPYGNAIMAIELTREKVQEVARLARLKLTDQEIESFTSQLGQVLDYVNILAEVDTAGVEPMAHAVEQFNVLREDVVGESLPREAALANAPKTDGRFFQVPQILESS